MGTNFIAGCQLSYMHIFHILRFPVAKFKTQKRVDMTERNLLYCLAFEFSASNLIIQHHHEYSIIFIQQANQVWRSFYKNTNYDHLLLIVFLTNIVT